MSYRFIWWVPVLIGAALLPRMLSAQETNTSSPAAVVATPSATMTNADSSAATPPVKPVIPATPYLSDLVYRFEPSVFEGSKFPNGSFEQDSLVRGVLGPLQVQTTFYNAKFQEVTQADMPGRYGAVVRITLGDAKPINRFVTLYRSPKKLFWRTAHFHLRMQLPPELGVNPVVVGHQQEEMGLYVQDALREDMNNDGELAVLLAGLSETSPTAGPALHRTDWWARDDAWWYELRKQIGLSETYPYLVQLPDGYDADSSKKWPLILFLHGSGERGAMLSKLNSQGLPKLIAQGRKFPAIIVSPQCPDNEWWSVSVLSQLVDDLSSKYRVDSDRISLTGLSMGGFGSWALALAYPDRFAAIAPICGGGDPPDAARLRHLPIWAFHGGKDDTVPIEMTIDMVDAIRKAGGQPHLTIFPHDGHNSWTDAYNTDALYSWLLAQKRGQKEVKTPGVPVK